MKKSQDTSIKSQVSRSGKPEISHHARSSAPVHVRPCLSVSVRVFALSVAAALLLSGCATEKIAEGLATKNTSGNGTVIESHIGIDPDNKIPDLKTLFISGDIATVKAGTNAVSYREESSSSVWNASCVTKKRVLAITLTDAGDVPAAIRAVVEVFKTAETAAAAQE